MKIGILTTFYELNSAYSLSTVVQSQMISLVENGYDVVLFTHDNFKDDHKVPDGVEIRKVVPRFLLADYSDFKEPNADLETQSREVYKMLEEHTKDVDVIFEHDLIFQGWFLPYCLAIHKFSEKSPIKWFHWTHSVPRPMPSGTKFPHNMRFQLPKNSKLVYLNNHHAIRAAESYNTFPKNVRVVYNPLDPRLFLSLHPLVKSMLDKYPILESDLVQVYPLSTPRMVSGKKLHDVIDIFSNIKKLGKSVSLIVCNAHANDRREKELIAQTKSYASQRGMNGNELIFTSLEDEPKYELGVSREIVSQLFQLSNLFIFPSVSENCSLVLLEAMLSKNLLVLNESVGSMKEFGQENALYFKFGGIDGDVNFEDKDKYMEDVAKIIISEFQNNKILKASNRIKKQFNYQRIFEDQILPLLHEA